MTSKAPWAQCDSPILSGFCRVLVNSRNTRFIDFERPARDVEIGHEEGDLLGRARAGEEPELIVVALCFAPIPVDCGDERLRFLDLKRVDPGAVLLLNACAPQAIGGVVLLGIIAITEPERTSQHTDRIVIGLLAPVSIVGHLDECRV